MEHNKKSGFKCMFVVCIAYYIWAKPPSLTSNYVLSADGKGLDTHIQQESVIVWMFSVDVGVDVKYGKQCAIEGMPWCQWDWGADELWWI